MVLFVIVGAVVIFVSGMVTMGIVASNGRYKATTEAYNIGYENGVKEEQERIGKLVDKYIEDLEKGKQIVG